MHHLKKRVMLSQVLLIVGIDTLSNVWQGVVLKTRCQETRGSCMSFPEDRGGEQHQGGLLGEQGCTPDVILLSVLLPIPRLSAPTGICSPSSLDLFPPSESLLLPRLPGPAPCIPSSPGSSLQVMPHTSLQAFWLVRFTFLHWAM